VLLCFFVVVGVFKPSVAGRREEKSEMEEKEFGRVVVLMKDGSEGSALALTKDVLFGRSSSLALLVSSLAEIRQRIFELN
jgi:hypothetical protein